MDAPTKRTSYYWTLEILTLLCLIWACYPLLFYGSISEDIRIPIHYNASGQVDGWGDRSYLWILALISFVFYILLSFLERFYKKFKYPVKVTENNANLLYRLGVNMIRHLKFFLVLMFAYLNNSSFATAIGKSTGINGFIMGILLFLLFMTIAVFYIRMDNFKEEK